MGFNLERAMSGAGSAVAEVGLTGLRNELVRQREQARQEWQTGENKKQRDWQSGENAETRRVTQEEGKAGRDLQERLSSDTNARIEREGKATRDLQRDLAEQQTRSADRRHRESIGLQMAQLKALNENVSLVPLGDGTIMKVRKDGTQVGLLSDSSGNAVMGPKDMSAATKAIVELNQKYMSALENDMKTAMPDEKPVIRQKIDDIMAQTQKLLGQTGDQKPAAQPGEADIARLKSLKDDPAAKSAFDQKFGAGAAQRALGQESQPARAAPGRPVSGLIDRGAGGYAAALDEVSPRRPRVQSEEVDQTIYAP